MAKPILSARAGSPFAALRPLLVPPKAARPARATFTLETFAGRLSELCATCAGATLTLAVRLVLEAQTRGEPTAWVTPENASFFPPDVADSGVDLDALVVVRVPERAQVPRAASELTRSGAFGLVILDLPGPRAEVPPPLLTRLLGLAQKHDAALVFLTETPPHLPSLGPLISLRAEAVHRRQGGDFVCALQVLKDKRQAPDWSYEEVCHGPAGLR